MIRLKITNKNGDILYERKDAYYVRFNEEDFEDIKNILNEIGSDTVYVDIDCDIHDNPFMVYSYHNVSVFLTMSVSLQYVDLNYIHIHIHLSEFYCHNIP